MQNLRKILVVEDDAIAQKIAGFVLMDLGCRVDIAKNGRDALNLYKNGDYDIVLTDLGLPDISGIEVIKAIKKLDNGKSKSLIIALTVNYDNDRREMCIKHGVDDFMMKPLTKQSAAAMLDKFFASQQVA